MDKRPFFVFLLLLLLLTSLTLLSVNYKISKVEGYAESIEESVDIVGAKIGNLAGRSQKQQKQLGMLEIKDWILKLYIKDLRNDIKKLEAQVSKESNERERLTKLLGIDGRYDMNNILVKREDLDAFLNYGVYATVRTLLELPAELKMPEVPLVKISGSPAIIIGKYVLMASHTTDPEEINEFTVMIVTPNGAQKKTFTLKVLEHKVAITAGENDVELAEMYRNKEKDFVLYELPAGIAANNFPFEIGRSSELRVGDFVYINGRPSIPFEVARPGYVSALNTVPRRNNGGTKGGFSSEMEISQSTDSGDSGSPIIAFRDGKPELVGLYLGWLGDSDDNGKNTRSRALKIDAAVDEIKEKLGIDLRGVQHNVLSGKTR